MDENTYDLAAQFSKGLQMSPDEKNGGDCDDDYSFLDVHKFKMGRTGKQSETMSYVLNGEKPNKMTQ